MSQHKVTLLLGSNLGNTKFNLETAISLIEAQIGTVIARTEILVTEPVEFDSNRLFRNIAIIIGTDFSPINLLKSIKSIERFMGRKEDTSFSMVYTDRLIDIDVVLFDNIKFNCEKLTIPHDKHIRHRDFSIKLINALKTQ